MNTKEQAKPTDTWDNQAESQDNRVATELESIEVKTVFVNRRNRIKTHLSGFQERKKVGAHNRQEKIPKGEKSRLENQNQLASLG